MANLRQTVRFCVTSDQVRIAYATMGSGAPLVRTAHFMTHIELDVAGPVWAPWLSELSRDRLLVRYDGRNCGLSDRTTTPTGLDAWLADLEAVIDAAKLDCFSLFGCSQGGAIAIAYATKHPERVASLVLLGSYARGPMKRDDAAQVSEFRALLDLIRVGWGRDNPAFRQVFTSLLIPQGTAEQIGWFNEIERLTISPDDAARLIEAFGQIDVSAEATAVRCPTLVLHSRGDARVPYEEGRRLAGLIPGARFVSLDSRNHVLLENEPAFRHCFDEVRSFLGEHASQAAGARVFASLTKGDRDLVELLAQGLDNLQISARLGLSEKTVRNKVSAVFTKLAVETRAQAIVRAREAGFGAAPSTS